ncbi:MAG TPA: DsbA family protein [Caulobacterales bacterium]|nr:DsbA family protein [Caulobacterales bacterium]
MFATRRGLMIGAGALPLAMAMAGCQNGASADANSVDASDMEIGDPKARVRVVEYASLTCPHCAAFHADVWPKLKANYIDTGKIRFAFREFPTPPQEVALAGFQLARCGPQPDATRYFAVVDVLFDQQQTIFAGMEKGALREELLRIAKAAGISEEAFESCVTDPKGGERVSATVAKAQKLKVTGTPTFFVNGEKQGVDALTYEGLSKILNAKLAAS